MMNAHASDRQPRRCRYSVRGLSNWILDLADRHGQSVTNMALNKLLYFAYEKTLVEKGLILTEAKIEAWDHGPVFREAYHAFKKHGDKDIKDRVSFYSVDTGNVEISTVALDSELEQFLEGVIAPLLPLSASRLRQMSHVEGGAWHKVWSYEGHANPGMEISPELILITAKTQDDRHAKH